MKDGEIFDEEGHIEVDEETGYVVLREPDGKEHGFFIECKIEVEDNYYVVLIPEEEDIIDETISEDEITGVVFRIEEDEDGSETWVPVEDEDEFQRVVDALEFYEEIDDDEEEL